MNIRTILISLFCITEALTSFAQGEPIGQWRSHLPYNRGVSLASDGQTLYVAGKYSFFTYHITTEEITTLCQV